MKIIDQINGYFKVAHKKKINDDVAPIAYITQEIESDFVLGIVCFRKVEQYPDIPIYTIHDAIYNTNEFADNVHEYYIGGGESLLWRRYKREEEAIKVPPAYDFDSFSSLGGSCPVPILNCLINSLRE